MESTKAGHAFCTVMALALLPGCSGHYLLKSQFVASTQAESPPELVETPTYKGAVAGIKVVAVRAPDSCANRTTDSTRGSAASQETVLKTSCGVEMAEVERNLARAGYQVISWKDLNAAEAHSGKSTREVALALGADVIFQINSLEKSTKSLGKDARWERSYYDSNARGEQLREHAFSDQTRTYFRNTFLSGFENSVNTRRQSVSVDATAIRAMSGESIWYYRWTYADPIATGLARSVLVRCKDEEDPQDRYCIAETPQSERPEPTKTMSSGESEALSMTERPEDLEKALYASLLSEVIANMVRTFANRKADPTFK